MNNFTKGLRTDEPSLQQLEGSWRDAKNVLFSQGFKVIENEPGFDLELEFSLPVIGVIATPVEYVVFLSNNITSEIGFVKNGVYTSLIKDPLLGFRCEFPIEGVFKYNYKQELIIAWTDYYNRPCVLNINNLPFPVAIDKTFVNPTDLNLIRLFPNIKIPNISSFSISSGGRIKIASYQFTFAYEISDNDITNWSILGNPIYIAKVNNNYTKKIPRIAEGYTNQKINLNITGLDESFTYVRIATLININGTTTAQEVGKFIIPTGGNLNFSYTGQIIRENVNPAEIIIPTETFEKVRSLTEFDSSLLLGYPTSAAIIDYQKYANNIEINWQYDPQATTENSFMPKEVVALYFHWILKDGSVSQGFHIPGRKAEATGYMGVYPENITLSSQNAPVASAEETLISSNLKVFHSRETGTYIGEWQNSGSRYGKMGYWENATEIYPDTDEFDVYKTDIHGIGIIDSTKASLKNQPVRHHKIPGYATLLGYTSQRIPYQYYDEGSGGMVTNNYDCLTPTTELTGAIGIIVDNIYLPVELVDKVQGYFISYAKRDNKNNWVLGETPIVPQELIDEDADWQTRASGIRTYDFNILHDKTQLTSCFLEVNYKVDTNTNFAAFTKRNLDYTFGADPNPLSFFNHSLTSFIKNGSTYAIDDVEDIISITNPIFLPEDNSVSVPSNLYREETLYMDNTTKLDFIREPFGNIPIYDNFLHYSFYFASICQFIENCYYPFYNQKLISTGKIISISLVSGSFGKLVTSPVIYGGDVKLCDFKVNFFDKCTNLDDDLIWTNDGNLLKDHLYTILSIPVNSDYELSITDGVHGGLIQSETGAERIVQEGDWFISKVGSIEPTGGEIRCKSMGNITWLRRYPFGMTWRTFSLINSNFCTNDITKKYTPYHTFDFDKINVAFTILNETKIPSPFNPYSNFTNVFPYRIYGSITQQDESYSISWRSIPADNYFEQIRNKGSIFKILARNKILIIFYEHSTFTTQIDNVLEAKNLTVYLGQNNIFQRKPDELVSVDTGYAGNQSRFATFSFKYGVVFPSRYQGKIFIYGDKLDEISNIGMKTFFLEKLNTYNEDIQNIYLLYNLTSSFEYDSTGKFLLYMEGKDAIDLDCAVDNPFINKGICGVFDEKYNRLIFSINNKKRYAGCLSTTPGYSNIKTIEGASFTISVDASSFKETAEGRDDGTGASFTCLFNSTYYTIECNGNQGVQSGENINQTYYFIPKEDINELLIEIKIAIDKLLEDLSIESDYKVSIFSSLLLVESLDLTGNSSSNFGDIEITEGNELGYGKLYLVSQYDWAGIDDCSFTISYDVDNKFWVSFHDYIGSYFFNTQDATHVVKNNNLLSIGAIYKMNSNTSKTIYFGNTFISNENEYEYIADPPKESYIDLVFNSNIEKDKALDAISWITKKFDENGLVINNKTISKIIVYSDKQCTGEIDITAYDLSNRGNVLQSSVGWIISYLRDNLLDNTLNFMPYGVLDKNCIADSTVDYIYEGITYICTIPDSSTDSIIYNNITYSYDKAIFIGVTGITSFVITGNATVQAYKEWYDKKLFIGKYVIIRLIYDNDIDSETNKQYTMTINSVDVKERVI